MPLMLCYFACIIHLHILLTNIIKVFFLVLNAICQYCKQLFNILNV